MKITASAITFARYSRGSGDSKNYDGKKPIKFQKLLLESIGSSSGVNGYNTQRDIVGYLWFFFVVVVFFFQIHWW